MHKLKHAEIAPTREAIKKAQGNKCALCEGSFTDAKLVGRKLVPLLRATLDHNHKTGFIRGVLCNHCNGMEGKIFNRANSAKRDLEVLEWLGNLLDYWQKHDTPQTPYIHPTHKTDDEKRLARNKKARQHTAAKRASQILRKQ